MNGNFEACASFSPALEALTFADLSARRLRSAGPLSALRSLQRLDLSDNAISDARALSGLEALRVLSLRGNPLADVPENILPQAFPSLVSLSVERTMLASVKGLERYASLTDLFVGENGLRSLAGLEKLPALTQLDAHGNALETAEELRAAGTLVSLDLSRNALVRLDFLPTLRKLQRLDASRNALTRLPSLSEGQMVLGSLFLAHNALADVGGLLAAVPGSVRFTLGPLRLSRLVDSDGRVVQEEFNYSGLKTLDLAENRLTGLAPELAKVLDKANRIRLVGNPIVAGFVCPHAAQSTCEL